MSDNAARARTKISSHRKAIADHIDKWRRYSQPYEKEFALKTIRNAQTQITKLKDAHPSLRHDNSSEDTWSPPNR